MSSDPSQSPPESTSPAKKPRSPVERIIVWGLILVLLAVAGAEAMARYGYENSLKTIEATLDDLEAEDPHIKVDELDNYVFGLHSTDDNTEDRIITCTWKGVFKEYGTITMPYSRDNLIRAFATADAAISRDNIEPTEEEMMEPSEDDAVADAGEGEGGGRGGGRRFDPMQNDADGDGKLSLEEAPERMQENFAEIDTNSDGFADEAELDAYRAAMRERFEGRRGGRGGEEGRGEGGDERPERPQRPEVGGSDDESPAQEATETEAETSTPDE